MTTTHDDSGGPPAVQVRGLVKRYGDKAAVDGLDLDIHPGEIVALLGPNGAGKTTTVEILEGYRNRDAGQVSVLGSDPGRPRREWRSRIGIVLQSGTDGAELTVGEIVHHFAGYYPIPRNPDEVIAAVGLADRRDVRIRALSGGQRRRLDVALGVIGNPELLFLDEPTTGFDPRARRSFWDLIHTLRDQGTTILLTTHYLDEAEHLADRVAVINRGRIIATDTPQGLGGRGAYRAKVCWEGPEGPKEESTTTPTAFVSRLADEFGGEVPGLQVLRPSLEDIYLEMISSTEDTENTADTENTQEDLR
jgi:ABC-2 type transport system ATP-binding protein